jgi:hypothetical protein
MSKQLTKVQIRELRSQIDAALLPVLKANGLSKLEAGNCSFNPEDGTFTFKLQGAVIGAPTEDDKNRENYTGLQTYLGLPPLGTKVTIRNITFTTTGLKKNGRTVLLDGDNGKKYQMYIEVLLGALKANQN